MWNEIGVGGFVVAAIALFGLMHVVGYLGQKGAFGAEGNSAMPGQYTSMGGSEVQPADQHGNAQFASAAGLQTTMPANMPGPVHNMGVQDPSELLPRDSNAEWAQLNPIGKGELANVSLLKAGQFIGLQTSSNTLRNANLQFRSDPEIPKVAVGPWNQSTIEKDPYRREFEIGGGGR